MSDVLADLDPAAYVQPPVLDVPSGLALGGALLEAADATMPATVQRAANRIQTAMMVLEHHGDDPVPDESETDDARIADLRLDRAWVAVGRRLEVLVDLPPELAQTQQATELHRSLFPDGLAFLNLPFRQQWAHSEERLRMVEDEDLGPILAPLVGGFVLDELWAAHEEYGRVLGIEDPAAGLTAPARRVEGLRELRDAIAIYALQLLAVAHDDLERADAVRTALYPIDVLRRGPFERPSAPDSEPPTEAETPDDDPVETPDDDATAEPSDDADTPEDTAAQTPDETAEASATTPDETEASAPGEAEADDEIPEDPFAEDFDEPTK